MTEVKIVDTTLRDGHQCLWATRMSTPMMLPVLDKLDRAGFHVLEVMGAVQFDTCVRYLQEDPWARIRTLKEKMPGTPLQALIRSKCALAFELQPDDVACAWVERLMANGIDRFIAFDGLHDLDNLVDSLLHAKKLGAYTTGWLIFSDSPIHTDELYVAKAREFLDRCKCDALMIEDTSGILTPERAATLVPALKREIGEVSLGLHVHNLVGLAQRTHIEAVKHGVDHIYTCISPIADGNAPPSIQTTARNLRYLGYDINVDDGLIDGISRHFEAIALAEDKPIGRPQDFDAANFGHQVPGGVLSNLVAQLEAAGLGHKIGEVLTESTRVREELGWPIQVTPFSQFIGVQAALNVIEGERYSRIPDEVKKYALGHYGKLLAPVHPDVLDRIVENGSKAIKPATGKPDNVLPGLRKQYRGAGDDEILLRLSFPGTLVEDMYGAAPDQTDYSVTDTPLLLLIQELSKKSKLKHVFIQKGSMKVDLRK